MDALAIPRALPLEAVPLAQGEHNANFLIVHPETGRKLVLRINFESQLGLDNQIAYEASALRALEPSGRTARVLYVDDSLGRIDHGVLVMEFLEGRHLDFARPGDVEEAARILADIHSVVPGEGSGLIKPEDPLRTQVQTCHGFFERYCTSPYADSMVIDYVERFFDRFEDSFVTGVEEESRHIQNTEAVPSHFLIADEGPGHMVDWEKPVIGEVAQDLAYFMSPTSTIWDTDYLFDPPARKRFLDEYWRAVDGRFRKGQFDERYPLYVMSNALIGITWSCNAIVDYSGEKVLRNKKTEDLLGVYVSEPFLKRVEHDCFDRRGL